MRTLPHSLRFQPESDGAGAAGTGDGSGTQEDTQGTSQVDTSGAQDGGTTSTNDTEISKLRAEAAKYRTERNAAQTRLKELEDAGKSDVQKAADKATEAEQKVADLESKLRKQIVSVVGLDVGIVKEARADAAALLDWDTVADPTSEKDVEKALRALVKEKPYLLGNVAGGADGGTGGRSGAKVISMNDRLRQAAGRR